MTKRIGRWAFPCALAAVLAACPAPPRGLSGVWFATEAYDGVAAYHVRYELRDDGATLEGTVANCDAGFSACGAATGAVRGARDGDAAEWAYTIPGEVETHVSGRLEGSGFSGTAWFVPDGGAEPIRGPVTMARP